MNTVYTVYLDTETDYGAQPKNPTTVQIGLHCQQLGIELRLGGAGHRGADLWLSALRILTSLIRTSGTLVVLAHNGFNFDFMNLVTEAQKESRIAEVEAWLVEAERSGLTVRFADTIEILMNRRDGKTPPPNSFSLDALYGQFLGRIIKNRHDGLEDARALRQIMDAAGFKSAEFLGDGDGRSPPVAWSDIVAMHRSWSVRDGLIKNPSRPAPVPRVFPVRDAFVPVVATSSSGISPSLVVTLFKYTNEPDFTATLARSCGFVLYVLSGSVADRYMGVPGRMRAWCQIFKSVGRKTNVTSLFFGESAQDHPLMVASQQQTTDILGVVNDPPCIVPDATQRLVLMDPYADKIAERIAAVARASPPSAVATEEQSRVTSNTNAKDASMELHTACTNLTNSAKLELQWKAMGVSSDESTTI
ncbi:exonuclease domain-containing protein [Medusavirus stheno T3]|uniref:Exonuclease domain-containing protein n=1 Tax=Medusavirus stheno T3 TaxID=3069717 RepID=A0A7S8BDQ3_9VIRU|nr:exonuclease domain-containing protein [Acanthamoeba castellanii medusavirus]QPB44434.1 exonuclease domain-containing protein [Medusavirus stheno T3]